MTLPACTLAATPADGFGTAPLGEVFTVFADHPDTGASIDCWRSSSHYTASALANHAVDLGYVVATDMGAPGTRYAPDEYAMVTPDVWHGYRLDLLEAPAPVGRRLDWYDEPS